MSLTVIFAGVAVILLVSWLYSVYVSVIKAKNKVEEAMASVDVQLRKRYDLMPNVLFLANKFMEHERSLIEDITKLRTSALKLEGGVSSAQDKINISNEIQKKMGELFVSVENYPQLKSDNTMVQAMKSYSDVEEHIAAARRFYNAAVRDLKNVVQIWPSSSFASTLGIKADMPYFEVENEAERAPINAQNYFN